MNSNRRLALARTLLTGLSAWVVTGCGFQLRQAPKFAFSTLAASLPDSSPLRRELRSGLVSSGITVVDPTQLAPAAPGADAPSLQADAVLEILNEQRERAAVGITTAGQVSEFQLRVRFKFRLRTLKGKDLLPDSEILLQRDISYSETLALSKEEEIAEMYRDMQTDVVQQVLRRLASVRSL